MSIGGPHEVLPPHDGRSLYWAMRARGHGHQRALRGLADRLLACLIATLREDVLYDPARRARHLTPPMAA